MMYEFWLATWGFAFVFTALVFLARRFRTIFALISMVVWLFLSAGVAQINVPYAFYREVDNTVVTGAYPVSGAPGLTAFAFGMAMVCFVFVWLFYLDAYLQKRGKVLFEKDE